jgi:hypothetical protein
MNGIHGIGIGVDTINSWSILDELSNCWLLRKESNSCKKWMRN